VDALVHQFKGSSASFGAHTMALLCVQLRDACHAHNQPACQQLVQQLRESFVVLKARLEQFMALEAQRKKLGGQ
jgi:histidine-containing phosphotransfer protein